MVDADRPLIALNGSQLDGAEPGLQLHHRYAEAVLRAGGLPVGLPAVGGPRDIEQVLQRIDGLVLCGGDDFDTARLGLGPTHPSAVVTPTGKQDYDMALTRAALESGTPSLGICYGMQCLGIAGGGDLHQHLPEDRPDGQEHAGGVEHPVHIEAGSKLAATLGVVSLSVISRHHQALSTVGAPWCVSASDQEGLIEAIEHPSKAFAIGVQWHPELSPEGSAHERLFRALVHASSTRRADKLFARSRP